MSGSSRPERVAERVRAELMDLLLRGEVRDPAASEAFVSAVQMSPDLKIARVYVRSIESQPSRDADGRNGTGAATEPSPARRRATMRGLRRAAGHIRRQLAPRLKLRYMPELRFVWDEAADHGQRIEALLAEIREEDEGST